MSVPVVRSWPRFAPWPPTEHGGRIRPHVVDTLERVEIENYDYTPVRDLCLAGADTEGVIHLDWDVAVLKEDLKRMRQRAVKAPTRGFVAPYRLYPAHVWAHGRAPGVPVDHGEPSCVLPCWGCIYVPRKVLEAWEPAAHDPRLTDTNFAIWANDHGLVWPIDWTISTIHLHW